MGASKNLPKSETSSPCAPAPILEDFGWLFASLFQPTFMIQRLLNCNNYNAKVLFLLLKASYFAITNPSKNVCFTRCLPRHTFGWFYVRFMCKLSILGPLHNPVGAKTGSKIDRVVPTNLKTVSLGLTGSVPGSDKRSHDCPKHPEVRFWTILGPWPP